MVYRLMDETIELDTQTLDLTDSKMDGMRWLIRVAIARLMKLYEPLVS